MITIWCLIEEVFISHRTMKLDNLIFGGAKKNPHQFIFLSLTDHR